jgi:hypothetical protein
MNDCDQRDLITGTAMPRVLAAIGRIGLDRSAVPARWPRDIPLERGFVAEPGWPSLRDGARLGFRADGRIRKLPPLPVVRARGRSRSAAPRSIGDEYARAPDRGGVTDSSEGRAGHPTLR